MNRTIALIPARGGSVEIPKKNIRLFCGRPLIDHVLFALEISNVSEIYVATEDEEIKNEVNRLSSLRKVFVYDRKPENAGSNSSTESLMKEFLDVYPMSNADLMLVQCTNPFLQASHINQAIGMFTLSRYDSIISCSRLNRFIWRKNEAGEANPINYKYWDRPFRKDFKSNVFIENGSFYLNSVKNIKAYGNRLSGRIGICEMPEYSSIELDSENDWITAEKIFDHYFMIKAK